MIYISSSCVKKNNIADIIRELADNNIRNIELSGGTDYYDNIEFDLRNLKERYCLNYVCHAYFPPSRNPFVVNLASCNDAIYKESIEHYTQCIEMMKRLGCKVLSLHAGFLVEVRTDEIGKQLNNRVVYEEKEAYERFCNAYEYIEKQCRENGISLFLENNVLSGQNLRNFDYHNYMMMTDYASIMKMREQLKFDLLLDIGHLHVTSNALELDFTEECRNLRAYIKWIHISENNGIIDEHKPLQWDSEIMREFRKIYNPRINVTLETAGSIEEILLSIKMIRDGEDG